MRHQICEFHVKKINKSILKAVTQVRRELEKTRTKRTRRGRQATKEDKAVVRKNARIQCKITVLFDHRRGYDAAKNVNGRKRHIMVDTLGLIMAVVIHAASVQDYDGAKLVFQALGERFT